MSSGNGSGGVVEEVKFEDVFGVSPEVAKVASVEVRGLLKDFCLAQIEQSAADLTNKWAEVIALIQQAKAAMEKRPLDMVQARKLVQQVVHQGQEVKEQAAHIWRAWEIAEEYKLAPLTEDALFKKIEWKRPQPSEASVPA